MTEFWKEDQQEFEQNLYYRGKPADDNYLKDVFNQEIELASGDSMEIEMNDNEIDDWISEARDHVPPISASDRNTKDMFATSGTLSTDSSSKSEMRVSSKAISKSSSKKYQRLEDNGKFYNYEDNPALYMKVRKYREFR